MDPDVIEQVLDQLLPALEATEAQTAALVQFLKAKGVLTEEEFAPFLEQAGNASNVRARVARVRIKKILSSALMNAKTEASKEEKQDEKSAPSEDKAQRADWQKEPSTGGEPVQNTGAEKAGSKSSDRSGDGERGNEKPRSLETKPAQQEDRDHPAPQKDSSAAPEQNSQSQHLKSA
jgi:hypothetical protein